MLKVKLGVVLYFLLLMNLTYAQGNIKGTVTDTYDNQPLYGANIVIIGTSLGTATDMDGKYSIKQVPVGNVQVKFSYIGYETQIIDVAVVDGKTLELDIDLKAAVLEGEEIEVTAQALGQVAAINQQLASNTIINVVSEEKIQELPDANAAEALGRLPGVSIVRSGGEASKVMVRGLSDKYLNVTIDGVRIPTTDALERGLDLSTIAQSSLAGIELFKALTPDRDGDAIAGSINFVTPKAPEQRMVRATLKGGYNKIADSYEQYDFSFKYGERFFDGFLGIQINGNLEKKSRNNENIDVNFETNENTGDYFINNLDVQYIDEDRIRRGAGIIFDFNTPDDGNIKLSSSYSYTKRDYLTHQRDYPLTGGSVTYEYRQREQEIDIFTNSLMGKNHLIGLDVDWGVSYSQSKAEYPFDYYASFVEASETGVAGMASGMPTDLRDHSERFIPYAYNNFDAAVLNDATFTSQDNKEDEFTANLDLLKEYVFSKSISGSIKGGAKFRSLSRDNTNGSRFCPYYLSYWRQYTRQDDGSIVQKDFSGSYFEEYWEYAINSSSAVSIPLTYFLDSPPEAKTLLDDFTMNPLVSKDKLKQWYELNKNGVSQSGSGKEYYSDRSVEADDYDVTETVTSGYLMNTLNIGQSLTIIAGVRVEHEHHDYNCKWSPEASSGFPVPVMDAIRDTSATYSETEVLPHLHFNIKATDFLNIRLAAYRAVARPDFLMRMPRYFAWRASETGGSKMLYAGNPDLKTAKAWNFELNTSIYGNEIGLFTVSGFYKRIDDMYHWLDAMPTTGDTLLQRLGVDWTNLQSGTYELTIPYNSPDASKVWGFEVDHQINFTWLPGLLSNIVLNYNFSWVKSETTLIGAVTDTVYVEDPILGPLPTYEVRAVNYTHKLEEQPEFFSNVALGYDIGGFSGRISMFHQSEFYDEFDSGGRSNNLEDAFTRIDLALKYKVQDYLTFLCNVNNLTNIKEKALIENTQLGFKSIDSMERYGLSVDFGVRVDL